jgi:hypothetical protein
MFNNIGKPINLECSVSITLLINADYQSGSAAGIGLQKNAQRLNILICEKRFQLLPGTLGNFKHTLSLPLYQIMVQNITDPRWHPAMKNPIGSLQRCAYKGCSKMLSCKAREIRRNETYFCTPQ